MVLWINPHYHGLLFIDLKSHSSCLLKSCKCFGGQPVLHDQQSLGHQVLCGLPPGTTVSMAYCSFHHPVQVAIRNENPDVLHPCSTPVVMSNQSHLPSWSSTAHSSLKICVEGFLILMMFFGILYAFMMIQWTFMVDGINSFLKIYDVQLQCCFP